MYDNSFFIGPYALGTVTKAHDMALGKDQKFLRLEQDLLGNRRVVWNLGGEWPGTGEGPERVLKICMMPRRAERDGPARSMLLETGELSPLAWEQGWEWPIATDWLALDRQAELDWFRTSFSPELAQGESLYGAVPVIRWGLVFWYP